MGIDEPESDSAAQARPAPTTLLSRFVKLGTLRDAALFLGTVTYVLGYFAWSWYAMERLLGFLPPLQGQYFVAGLFPTAILVCVYAGLRLIRPAETASARARAAKAARLVVAFVVALWIVGALSRRGAPGLSDAIAEATGVSFTLLIYFELFLLVRAGDSGPFAKWSLRIAAPLFGLVAIVFYATRVLPSVPGEFGGALPRCVQFDVNPAQMSPSLAAELGVQPAPSPARTRPLWLVFDGSSFVIVSDLARPFPRVTRVKESLINAMVLVSVRLCAPHD